VPCACFDCAAAPAAAHSSNASAATRRRDLFDTVLVGVLRMADF
jgi:hypothetical protein